jgi:hypothetical protein
VPSAGPSTDPFVEPSAEPSMAAREEPLEERPVVTPGTVRTSSTPDFRSSDSFGAPAPDATVSHEAMVISSPRHPTLSTYPPSRSPYHRMLTTSSSSRSPMARRRCIWIVVPPSASRWSGKMMGRSARCAAMTLPRIVCSDAANLMRSQAASSRNGLQPCGSPQIRM